MKESQIKKLSTVLFHLTWPVLAVSAFGVFVAMHRNLFGPSGENLYLLRDVWAWCCRLLGGTGEFYGPDDAWSAGNVLRPSLVAFCVSYLFALFVLCYGKVGETIRLRTLLVISGVIAIPLLIMPNIWSSDVFDYIVYGRLPIVYHSNPYITAIGEYPSDPFFNMTCWKASVSVYGPAWSLLSAVYVGLCELVRAGPAGYVFFFKLSSLVCHLASGALIWNILTRADVKTRAFGAAVYLLNPLTLIEFCGNAHNEAFMISMLLLGILLAQKNRWVGASVAFTLAVQTKFYVLPMFCLYVCHLWWRETDLRLSWRSAFSALAVFLGVSLILYLPFGLTSTTIQAPFYGVAANSMTKSLAEYFVYKSSFKLEYIPLLGPIFAGNQQDVQRLALELTFLVCLGCAAYARSLSRAVTGMAFFAFFWSTIGATWFMPWYLTVPLALAPVSGSRRLGFASVLASMTVFIIYLLEGWSYASTPEAHNFMVQYFQPFVFGPPLMVLLSFFAVDVAKALWRICTLRREEWARSN